MKSKRLTVYLSADLLFKIKFLALERGVKVSKLVEEILSEYTKEVQLPQSKNRLNPPK